MSPLLDERGRIGGRVNLVDLVAVVLVVALAVFLYVSFSTGGETATVRATFRISQVRGPTVDQVKEGQEVHDLAGNRLGVVEKVTVAPSRVEVSTADGGLKMAESSLYFDVTVVVEGQGTASSSSVRVGNVPLRVGKWIELVGPAYEIRSQVWGVEVVEEE